MAESSRKDEDRLGHGVGRMAVDRGLISAQDLEEALAEQAREADAGAPARRRPRPLGVILVAKGSLTANQLTGLLEERRARALGGASPSGDERLLGRILVERRQVTEEQVAECLRLQEACAKGGRPSVPRLGEILVDKGYVHPSAISQALASQQKTMLRCAACGMRYNVRNYIPGHVYSCIACRNPLEAAREADRVRVDMSGVFPSVQVEAAEPEESGGPPATPPAPGAAAPAPAAMPYVPLGKYAIMREIGRGGMGSVYEAILFGAMGFEKTVVIKTIREDFSTHTQFVDMFIGEAKLVADLLHQNICQVYQLDKVGNCYYIVMEHVPGVNLAQFMERHRQRGITVPPDLGTFIISRICRGLEYAHAKRDRQGNLLNLVHRDVSPKNILVSREGEVKLTDFGVAKARNVMRDFEGEILVGKAQYMSPEQAQYRPTDPRSDLFSLGVVMFELLTGQPVFEGESTMAIMRSVVQRHIPSPRVFNREIPPTVEQILMRALERDAERRYQTAGEMGHDLEYAIYHRGYGPTIVTLEKHLRGLFPELYAPGAGPPAREPMRPDTSVVCAAPRDAARPPG